MLHDNPGLSVLSFQGPLGNADYPGSTESCHSHTSPQSPTSYQTDVCSPIRPSEISVLEEYLVPIHDSHIGSASSMSPQEINESVGSATSDSPSDIQNIPTSWKQEFSPSMAATREPVLRSYPALQQSAPWLQYPSPTETSSSIGSLSGLSFSTLTVTQPVSFLRQTLANPAPRGANSSPDCESSVGSDLRHVSVSSPPNVFVDSRLQSPGIGNCREHMETESPASTNIRLPPVSCLRGHIDSPHAISADGFAPAVSNSRRRRNLLTLHAHPKHTPAMLTPFEDGNISELLDDFSSAESKWRAYLSSVTDNYGFDYGRPDLDLNKNNDHSAIEIKHKVGLELLQVAEDTVVWQTHEKSSIIGSTYYVSPVPINIPRHLSPLPATLLQNPINLMYFHHFLNHTAKLLVPHDCQDNPFVAVLPSMAISDSNLLNLMLAYSASHRARYLEHPEPANRIAHWVRDVFPALRLALESTEENISDSHLATAVMLLSLKIISPSTFEVPIPWQSHLKLARDLFRARGLERLSSSGNRIGIFLSRWFGYLDILGSLSCRHAGSPLVELTYPSLVNASCGGPEGDEYHIDCLTGYTARTGLFLVRLSALTHCCVNERFDKNGNFVSNWSPSPDIVIEAESLLREVESIRGLARARGLHYHEGESQDMIAIEEAFLSSGLLHLYRRVLDFPPDAHAVRNTHERLLLALRKIRKGSSAEVCALFPLFTAGCESQNPLHRDEIMERIEFLERTGMKQNQNARKLMQRCWEEDLPWIALARGEFLG